DGFDRCALLFIGADDPVERRIAIRRQVIGARTGEYDRARNFGRLRDAALNQRERRGPVEAHSALRGIHRFGDGEAERPEIAPIHPSRAAKTNSESQAPQAARLWRPPADSTGTDLRRRHDAETIPIRP